MMRKILLISVVFIMMFSAYSQADNSAEKPKFKDITSTIKLTKEFLIDPEEMEIVAFGTLAVDDEGNIYVYDPKLVKIAVFDKSGKFIRSFGSKGQGPSEFQFVTNMHTKASELIVTDILNRKFSFFKGDGSLVKELKFNKRVSGGILLDNGCFLFNEMKFPNSQSREMNSVLLLYNEKSELIKELFQIEMFNPSGSKIKGVYYNLCYDVSRGKIFIGGQGEKYEIYVYDSTGNLSRTIKKAYQPVIPSAEYKKNYIAMLGRFYNGIKEKLYFPSHLPPFHGFLADDKGRLFVMTYDKRNSEQEYLFDVFNSDGAYISSVFMPTNVSGEGVHGIIRNDRLHIVCDNQDGSQHLVVYKIKFN